MSAYVFLGPSLPIAEAPLIFDATYLPPVQQGDILRLLRRKPRFIGIVDGFFETVPAVWHKEILFALKSGVHVFGAASMGALRAAELHAFGMVGIGEVFAWYRDGVISSDDEVAVSHGPKELDYVAVNDTLVDIRDSCLSAVRAGVLTPDVADELIALGKAMPYRSRSFDAIAMMYGASALLSSEAGTDVITTATVTPTFFSTAGGHVVLGRDLGPADDGLLSVVISRRLWQRVFGGAATIVGQQLVLDRQPTGWWGWRTGRFSCPALEPMSGAPWGTRAR